MNNLSTFKTALILVFGLFCTGLSFGSFNGQLINAQHSKTVRAGLDDLVINVTVKNTGSEKWYGSTGRPGWTCKLIWSKGEGYRSVSRYVYSTVEPGSNSSASITLPEADIPDTPGTYSYIQLYAYYPESSYPNDYLVMTKCPITIKFQVTQPTYQIIAGNVRDSFGKGIESVKMIGLPGNPATDSQGHYSVNIQHGWSGVVTPTHSRYVFDPISTSYSEVTSDMTNANYIGIEQPGSLQIDKFTVKAGQSIGMDSVQFSGNLDVMESEMKSANEVVVSLAANDMTKPQQWVFPINESTFNKGIFSYKDIVSSFKFSLKNSKLLFSSRNVDLTGLSCPITVSLTICDYSASIELNEDIVNGPKATCPLQLLMGVKDSLTITKSVLKAGKLPNTDVFTAVGTFTVNGAFNFPADSFIVHLNDQIFTVEGSKFVHKNGVYVCANALANEGGYVTAKVDINKCQYTVILKRVSVECYGMADFGLGIFGCPLLGFERVNLGTAYTFWDITQYDQHGATWCYDSQLGMSSSNNSVSIVTPTLFSVKEDNLRDKSFYYGKEIDESACLLNMSISSTVMDGVVDLCFNDLQTYPSFLRLGQNYTDTATMTGTTEMTVEGQVVTISNGIASLTTVMGKNMAKVKVPAGTFSTVPFTDTFTLQGELRCSDQQIGTVMITLKQINYAVPGYGIVKCIRSGIIIIRCPSIKNLTERISEIYLLTHE